MSAPTTTTTTSPVASVSADDILKNIVDDITLAPVPPVEGDAPVSTEDAAPTVEGGAAPGARKRRSRKSKKSVPLEPADRKEIDGFDVVYNPNARRTRDIYAVSNILMINGIEKPKPPITSYIRFTKYQWAGDRGVQLKEEAKTAGVTTKMLIKQRAEAGGDIMRQFDEEYAADYEEYKPKAEAFHKIHQEFCAAIKEQSLSVPNQYILFSNHLRATRGGEFEGMTQQEIGKKAGAIWSELGEDEKTMWKERRQALIEEKKQRGCKLIPRRRKAAEDVEEFSGGEADADGPDDKPAAVSHDERVRQVEELLAQLKAEGAPAAPTKARKPRKPRKRKVVPADAVAEGTAGDTTGDTTGDTAVVEAAPSAKPKAARKRKATAAVKKTKKPKKEAPEKKGPRGDVESTVEFGTTHNLSAGFDDE